MFNNAGLKQGLVRDRPIHASLKIACFLEPFDFLEEGTCARRHKPICDEFLKSKVFWHTRVYCDINKNIS